MAPRGAPKLAASGTDWSLVPVAGCGVVNIKTSARAGKPSLLSVPKLGNGKCSRKFEWVSKDAASARFKVTKV